MKLILYLLLYILSHTSIFSDDKKTDEKNMFFNIRTTSDHHFRGYNYSMLADEKNNSPYKSVNFTPAIQPYFIYSLPLKGLKTLFWGNFYANNLRDRDSDQRILQDSPGGTEKFSTVQSEFNTNGYSTSYYPGRDKRYKERNGMVRYDGIFFGIYYEWNTKVGQWSVGTWIWNNLNRFGKYSWQEYFIWYEPPFWKQANLKVQYFLNTSFDSGGSTPMQPGLTNGQNYLALETSHKFFPDSFISVTPKLQGGYVQNNDNVSKRAGVSNVVGSLKFERNGVDLSFYALHRPEPLLYDTFDSNKSDGRLPDPGKQTVVDRYIADEISKGFRKEVANYINYQNTSEKFIKTVFIISIGYTIEF
jgi:hypothetical protein